MWILENHSTVFWKITKNLDYEMLHEEKFLYMCVLASFLFHNFVLFNLTEKNPNMCRCTAAIITANILFTGCSSF